MTPANKKTNRVTISIYLLGVICLAVLLYLDEHLFFMEQSLLLDILAIGILYMLLVTIFTIVRGHTWLAAALTIPLLLLGVIRYLNHFGEQPGHRFTELPSKGHLLGSIHVIPGFLDNTCYERSYYLPPGSVWLESIARMDCFSTRSSKISFPKTLKNILRGRPCG